MKLKYSDKAHGYWLDGKRCKSVTTLAKIPDDDRSLVNWKTRQIAVGLAKSEHLIASVAAHATDNGKLDELTEAAIVAAGADQAAEWGTTVHRITEHLDASEAMIKTPLTDRVKNTWYGLLAAAGLEVIPEYAERVVVYPEWRVAGKFDRLFRRKSDGKLVVGDLKTGPSSVNYPHSVSVQLSLYANAPLLCGQWNGLDGSTTDFIDYSALDIDREVGYVIFMPMDDNLLPCVHEVDIGLGWRCVKEVVIPTIKWRAVKKDRLIKPVAFLDA